MGGGSNPISDIVNTVTKAVKDTGTELGRVAGGNVNINPFTKQEEEAKDEARADSRQRDAAIVKQKEDAIAQVRVKTANKEAAGGGSNIILGGKRKKKKGSSVSSGVGWSTVSTGLQT